MKVMYNDIEDYCCRILDQEIDAQELPEGDIYYGDIRTIDDETLTHYTSWHLFAGIGGMPYGLRMGGWRDEWSILTAGFPCQPVSNAGKKLAQADPRWLWPAVVRILHVVRPPIVLLENTPGLLSRGMGDVIRDLAASGYNARWRVLAAADVGAPHLRERVWIVANAQSLGRESWGTESAGLERELCPSGSGGSLANSQCVGLEESRYGGISGGKANYVANPSQWPAEPNVGRVAARVPKRVDRIKALGNAVVPQVVAALVPWILEGEKGDDYWC